MKVKRTPSQTIGPFFHGSLQWEGCQRVQFAEAGEAIVLTGKLFDGTGEPLGDSLIETWQLSPSAEPPTVPKDAAIPHGYGRIETAHDGSFRIETLMPGAAGGSAPHIEVTVFARGLLRALRTRVYLADEAHVRADPILKPLAASERLKTLIASRTQGAADGAPVYHWNIRLQGDGETVFFAF